MALPAPLTDKPASQPPSVPAQTSGSEWSPAEARRVLWKVDLILMPVLTFSYGLQFYDKFVFSSGALFGLLADLQLQTPVPGSTALSTVRYSTATAAFYWGYIIGVLPIALLLQRLPVAKALSALIFVWGVIVILTPTVNSYAGAVVQRFFLGLVESAVSPGFVLVSSMWYTRAELPLRLGIWYSATGLFTIFSGLVNYGIGSASQTAPLHGWKYMYLFAGSLTLLWSAVLLAVLPDSPATSHRWFSEAERRILRERMRGNLQGADSRRLKWGQVREAAGDWKVWLMGAMGAAIYVCNGGVTAFGSLIIKVRVAGCYSAAAAAAASARGGSGGGMG
ncbi:MFS general substrate transporter [Calocera cornea HHB12733]|uniref:MFS general substrate transporter n=1 Tax=Calocera cornea HHB12733 TaxID=1353952 RepID=A0A165CHF2_9BASI|nr:MFS general substrate transporter [Calocera cornea HHB12733]